MRRILLSLFAVLAVGLIQGSAHAGDIHLGRDDCGFNSPYDIYVLPSGIRFERDGGAPNRVFMHDGSLVVDGKPVPVSAGDAARLRSFESGMRTTLPELAQIARSAIDISFDAITTVGATLTSDSERRKDLVDHLNQEHAKALERIDDTLGRGEWRQQAMLNLGEDAAKSLTPMLTSAITAEAMRAVMSGDKTQMAALEARADSLDKTIDKQVNERAEALNQRAQALCPRVKAMQAEQQQWQFRLADGRRLRLIRNDNH